MTSVRGVNAKMTNFEKYFGTPEKAAEFIDDITTRCVIGDSMCGGCRMWGVKDGFKYSYCENVKTIKEWMELEVVNND